MTGYYECKVRVFCHECGAGYEQHKAFDAPWPPWCCAECGADNIHTVLLAGGNVLTSTDPVHPLAFICPWCGLPMAPDGRDPVIDRCCGLCATFTLAERKQRNPEMGKLYDAVLLYDTTVSLDASANQEVEDCVRHGCDVGGHRGGGASRDRDRGDEQVLSPRARTERPGRGRGAMTQTAVAYCLLALSCLFLAYAGWRWHKRPRLAQPPIPRVVQLSGSATPLLIDDTLPAPVDDDSPTQPYEPRRAIPFFDVEVRRQPYRADQRLPRSAPAASGAITIEAKPIKGGDDDA